MAESATATFKSEDPTWRAAPLRPAKRLRSAARPPPEEGNRLRTGIEKAAARNNGKPLACHTALAEWLVRVSLRMPQKRSSPAALQDGPVGKAPD